MNLKGRMLYLAEEVLNVALHSIGKSQCGCGRSDKHSRQMDTIEINTDCSSNSSCSTVVDKTFNSKTNINFRSGFDNVGKNIYDLSEFEESSEVGKSSYISNDNYCSETLQKLSQKYFPSTSNSNSSHLSNVNEVIDLSDSSLDEDRYQCKDNLNEIFYSNNIKNNDTFPKTESALSNLENDIKETDIVSSTLNSSLKRTMNSNENGNGKQTKTKENHGKKKQKEPKLLKQKSTKKSGHPEKLLEDIIVNMDHSIFNNIEYGNAIKQYLESCCVTYRMISSLTGVISWSRKMYETDSSIPQAAEQKEKQYLLVLIPSQFGSLMQLIHDIRDHTNFHHLTVLVYGLSKPTPAHEEEMMEVDIHFPIFWQFVVTKEDLASFIFMATKSVAQIPYKKEQEEKYKLQNEYFNDSNKDVVKVDKKGNGLSRLWRQMLTMFPLARLETAEAIVAEYPTMSSFFQAYKECDGSGETLIQNLPIRRAQGPSTSVKKLGPELSRKCSKHFTSEENIFL